MVLLMMTFHLKVLNNKDKIKNIFKDMPSMTKEGDFDI